MSDLRAPVKRKASIGVMVKRVGDTAFKPMPWRWHVMNWVNDIINRARTIWRVIHG